MDKQPVAKMGGWYFVYNCTHKYTKFWRKLSNFVLQYIIHLLSYGLRVAPSPILNSETTDSSISVNAATVGYSYRMDASDRKFAGYRKYRFFSFKSV